MSDKYQKITVAGFLLNNGKALVIRRSKHESFLPGFCELPGGKVDFGEDPKQSLEREFKEEVNLSVKTINPYRIFTYISEKGRRHTVEIVYIVELHDKIQNLKLSEAHDKFMWITESDLDKINKIESNAFSDEIKTNLSQGFKHSS